MKPFISETNLPGYLDGPKLCIPGVQTITMGECLVIANSLGYVLLSEPRLGQVMQVRGKKLYGDATGGDDNQVRGAAVEVRKG